MKAITLLIKPASSLCNLRCKYCFYADEAQNRSQASTGIMTAELAEILIQKAFDALDEDGFASFTFQGGEPTVAGLDFFRHFVRTVKAKKPPKAHVSYSIQTNGTLLDDTWAQFLHDEHFLVGLSVDGFRDVHDCHRITASGEGTWKRVLAAKKLLETHRVEYNALCVVTKRCAEHPEKVYKNLKALGFRYMQFIACLDPIGKPRGQEAWSLTPEDYGKFLCRVFGLWYQDWAAGNYHSVRLFDDYIHVLLGDGASTCATCGKCGTYLVIEGDGSVYPCDFFCLDDWLLGSIKEASIPQLLGSGRSLAFHSRDAEKPAECAACPYGSLCSGGCRNDWFADARGNHNYYCAAFRTLLDHGLPAMRRIAEAERAARRQYRS